MSNPLSLRKQYPQHTYQRERDVGCSHSSDKGRGDQQEEERLGPLSNHVGNLRNSSQNAYKVQSGLTLRNKENVTIQV